MAQHGMHYQNGQALTGLAHLQQSVRDILTTPIGSRVMRRDYGSEVFNLIDQPYNPVTKMRIYAATAEALARWEPRLIPTRIQMHHDQGQSTVTITGVVREDLAPIQSGEQVTITAPLVSL